MQHLVVIEVVQQRVWHAFGCCRQKHSCAGNARWRMLRDAFDKWFDADGAWRELLHQHLPATIPSGEQDEQNHRYQDREPAAVHQLDGVGAEEREVDAQEGKRNWDRNPL